MRDALTSAREWGAQPLEMLGVSSGRWSEANRVLAQALTIHDQDLCPGGCGYYLDETADEDGHYEAHVVQCDACATRDRIPDDSDYKRQPGELAYVTRAS